MNLVLWQLLQAAWSWRAYLAYNHVLGALVLFWLWRVQPSSALSDASYASSQPNGLASSSVSSDYDDGSSFTRSIPDLESLLEDRVPDATDEERDRFLVAYRGNVEKAAKALSHYLEWRASHAPTPDDLSMVNTGDADTDDWNLSVLCAQRMLSQKLCVEIPRAACIRMLQGLPVRDREGFRVLHILPGMMDDRLMSYQTYALAVALYIDRKLARDSTERLTVVIDVRGGRGWRNPHAVKLLPFIKSTSLLLLALFPERMARTLVFPLPSSFAWIWKVVRRVLDPLTREKIAVLTGAAAIVSPPPIPQMTKHLSEEAAHFLEEERVAAFC